MEGLKGRLSRASSLLFSFLLFSPLLPSPLFSSPRVSSFAFASLFYRCFIQGPLRGWSHACVRAKTHTQSPPDTKRKLRNNNTTIREQWGGSGDAHAARTVVEKRDGGVGRFSLPPFSLLSPSLLFLDSLSLSLLSFPLTLKRYKLLHMHCIRV